VIYFVGDTRSRLLLERIASPHKRSGLALGQLVQRGRLAPWLRARAQGQRHWRWAYDNGAFCDWQRGAPFDVPAFRADLDLVLSLPSRDAPSWLVLPDIVAGGKTSLYRSLGWLTDLWGAVPCYLAVQEGFGPEDVPERDAERLAGIFIGGATWSWKAEALRVWSAWARPRGLLVHVGRVGSVTRIRHVREVGAHSADSNAPLWSADAWDAMAAELRSTQTTLWR
jgi:hypothetical protein